MPFNDEEFLAAVSAGVDSAAPETNTNDNSQADTGNDAGDDPGTDPQNNADGDGGEVPEGDADDKGAEADGGEGEGGEGEGEPEVDPKTGKPVAKADPKADDTVDPTTGKPYTPEQIAEKKAAKERADFLAEQERDPINAPIPKYLKEPTQKRMTKLVEIAKDLTTKFDTVMKDRNEIIGMITDTGATAQQYTQALAYLKMVNSRDPAQIQQAIAVMQAELNALSRMAGVPVAGVDLLADHADLKAAVEAKQITPELAQEIAAGREQRSVQHRQSQQQQQQTQNEQVEHQRGIQALNSVGRQLAASEGAGYKAKAQAVLAKIQPAMAKAHPSQWANMFLMAYSTYKAPAAPTPPVVRKQPVVPKNQPLRGNNPSGGQQKAATTIEEAIELGIASATRKK